MSAATRANTTTTLVFVLALILLCVGVAHGLRCYKCGQYNEGIGSITPCINTTANMHLQDCSANAEWCIKYVSEGSTVRDCVPTCVEKEVWSTRTYCCQQDGCNGGPGQAGPSATIALTIAGAALLLGRCLRG